MLGFGLLVLRVVVGLTVAAHGAQKLFGWFGGPGIGGFGRMLAQLGIRPERPWAVIAALAEFVGGLLVAFGLMTPLAALAESGSMLVAILTVHAGKGFWNMNGGIEFPLIILAAMVAIALTGPGVLSLDHLLSVRLLGPATSFVAALVVLLGVVAALISPKLTSASQSRPQVS